MSELLKIRPYGLVDGDNPLSDAPDGALEQAENVIISANGVVTPVDGFEYVDQQAYEADQVVSFTGTPKQMYVSPSSRRFVVSSVGEMYEIDASTSPSRGSLYTSGADEMPRLASPHSDADPIVSAGSTVDGSIQLLSSDGELRRRLPVPVTVVAPSAWTGGKWMSSGRAVAYRTTVVRRYANGRVTESPPSAPYIFRTHFYVTVDTVPATDEMLFSRPHGLTNGVAVTNVIGGAPGALTATVNTAPGTHKITLAGSSFTAGIHEVFFSGGVFTDPVVTARVPYWTEPNTGAPITTVRFYRTPSVYDSWGTPSTAYYLVGEQPLSMLTDSGTDYYQYATLTDSTPDEELSSYPLAPFGELSVAAANPTLRGLGIQSWPDQARDMALWASKLWLAGYTEEPQAYIELLGTSASSTSGSLNPGDTLIVPYAGTLTAVAEGSPPLRTGLFNADFTVASSGDVAYNLETSIYNMMDAASQTLGGSTWFVYPISEGAAFLRTHLFSSFSFTCSDSTAFNPAMSGLVLPKSVKKNAVWPSEPDQFETFDPEDVVLAGLETDLIRRVLPWKDRLFVFKESEGVFVVYNNGSGYSVSGPVSSGRLLAPEAVASVGDEVYAWTHLGVLRLSAGGAGESVSGDVDDFLLDQASPSRISARDTQKARMVGDEIERTVTLWTDPDEDGRLQTGYVFNVDTRRWSVRSDVLMECVTTNQNAGRPWAFIDGEFATPRAVDDDFRFSGPSSTASYTVSGDTITDGTTDMKAGDAFVQGASIGYVTANDGAGVLTLAPGHGLATGSMTYYPAIQSTIAFQPFYLNDPGTQKLISDATVFMSPDSSGEPQAAFVSERAPDEVFTEGPADGYGMNGYGDGYYSGQFRAGVTFQANTRTGNVRAPSIIVRFCRAFSNWKFWGLGVNVTKGLERPRG